MKYFDKIKLPDFTKWKRRKRKDTARIDSLPTQMSSKGSGFERLVHWMELSEACGLTLINELRCLCRDRMDFLKYFGLDPDSPDLGEHRTAVKNRRQTRPTLVEVGQCVLSLSIIR